MTVVHRCPAGGNAGSGAGTMPRAKTRQQKVQLSNKMKHFAHLGMTNLLLL